MQKIIWLGAVLALLTACDDAKKAGDETARALTGSNMIKQGNAMKEKIKGIEAQQKQRFDDLDAE